MMKEMSSTEIEEIRIGVPWGVVAAKCWNSSKGQPVLVVHGLGENAGAFDGLIPLLSPDHYFVAVDLPGHGKSSPFPRGITPDFMLYVNQLLRVVRYFKWNKLCLMGHSFGAHLLEFFAATYADKVVPNVEKLILIDAISPTPVPSEVFLLFHKNLAKEVTQLEEECREPTRYAYEEALEQVASRRMSKVKPETAKRLLERCLRASGSKYVFTTDPRTRAEIKPAIGEEVLFELIKQIRCPVLVILADDSELFRLLDCPTFYSAALDILVRSHPASTVVRVPGNHCVHSDHPDGIAPIVNGFLSGRRCKI